MEPFTAQPNILHLAGISLNDYVPVEDLFDSKLLEAAEPAPQGSEPLPYDRIPPVFVGVDQWPSSTNLRCWSCPFTFDGPPSFAPTYIRPGDGGRLEAGVEGNFCTFNCAARYIDTVYPPQAFPAKHFKMRDNLCTIYALFTGRRVRHIAAAPPKTELQMYGGTLTEENYWEALRQLDLDHGLRDHRLGSIATERARPGSALAGKPTAWETCLASAPLPVPPALRRSGGPESADEPPALRASGDSPDRATSPVLSPRAGSAEPLVRGTGSVSPRSSPNLGTGTPEPVGPEPPVALRAVPDERRAAADPRAAEDPRPPVLRTAWSAARAAPRANSIKYLSPVWRSAAASSGFAAYFARRISAKTARSSGWFTGAGSPAAL